MPQKAHLKGFKREPPKRHFLIPKMSFSRFSALTSAGGLWDRKPFPYKTTLLSTPDKLRTKACSHNMTRHGFSTPQGHTSASAGGRVCVGLVVL